MTRILENTDKQSVLQRIKEEIKRKIALNRYALTHDTADFSAYRVAQAVPDADRRARRGSPRT